MLEFIRNKLFQFVLRDKFPRKNHYKHHKRCEENSFTTCFQSFIIEL